MFNVLKHRSNKMQHTDGPEPVSTLGYPDQQSGRSFISTCTTKSSFISVKEKLKTTISQLSVPSHSGKFNPSMPL